MFTSADEQVSLISGEMHFQKSEGKSGDHKIIEFEFLFEKAAV